MSGQRTQRDTEMCTRAYDPMLAWNSWKVKGVHGMASVHFEQKSNEVLRDFEKKNSSKKNIDE